MRVVDSFGKFGLLLASSLAGCGAGNGGTSEQEPGQLQARLALSAVRHDVTAIRIELVAAESDCQSPPIVSKTIALADTAAPGGGAHPFVDALFVVEPGAYRACATPLAGETPSLECAGAQGLAEITAGVTRQLSLISQCRGAEDDGGLGVAVSLNDQPRIEELSLAPSAFITVCDSLDISVRASDANGDELSYSWSVLSGPDASLHVDGAHAAFSGAAGDYVLRVEVEDGHAGSTALDFPVSVSAASCAVPEEVQAIFTSRCTPCHTEGSSGGLHLDPATASYANLVNVPSSRCADRTRVLPGDAAGSYLLAKLHGDASICGSPMPLNRPALPAEELAVIESWIDALPH